MQNLSKPKYFTAMVGLHLLAEACGERGGWWSALLGGEGITPFHCLLSQFHLSSWHKNEIVHRRCCGRKFRTMTKRWGWEEGGYIMGGRTGLISGSNSMQFGVPWLKYCFNMLRQITCYCTTVTVVRGMHILWIVCVWFCTIYKLHEAKTLVRKVGIRNGEYVNSCNILFAIILIVWQITSGSVKSLKALKRECFTRLFQCNSIYIFTE